MRHTYLKGALALICLTVAALALSAFQSQTITLTNPSDYGNLVVAIEQAQGGSASQVTIGTRELGTVTVTIPSR